MVNQRQNVWWQKTEKSSLNWLKHICIWIKRENRLHCSHTVNILVRRLFICLMFMLCFYFFSTLLSFCGQIGCVPGIWWHHWRLLGRSFSFCCVCLNMIGCIKRLLFKKNPQPSRLLLAKCELCSFFFPSCCTEGKLHNPAVQSLQAVHRQPGHVYIYSLYYLVVHFFKSPLKTQQLV